MDWEMVDPAIEEQERRVAFAHQLTPEEEDAWPERVQDMKDGAAAKWKKVTKRHGPDCPCAVCLEQHADFIEEEELEFPTPPFWGFTLDGHRTAPVPVMQRLEDLGEIVTKWNFPHHGRSGIDCGNVLQHVAVVNPAQNLEWWTRMVRCGARNCPNCAPKKDDKGEITMSGAWEVRTARRAADAIQGHLEDLKRGIQWMPAKRCLACIRDEHHKLSIGEKCGACAFVRTEKPCPDCTPARHVHTGKFLHDRPKLAHLAVSPPPEAWDALPEHERTVTRLHNLNRTALRFLRDLGIRAGYKVTHSHRIPGRFNDRSEPVEGLHFHVIGLTKNLFTPWVDGKKTKALYERTGWVIKRIVAQDNDGPELGHDPFATLLYLLSHATWPSYASLRQLPGRPYPAWCETSTQAKALAPFGAWVRPSESIVVTPLEEDTSPVSGQGFGPDAILAVEWVGPPPPHSVEFGTIPRGKFTVNHRDKTVQIRLDHGTFSRPSLPSPAFAHAKEKTP